MRLSILYPRVSSPNGVHSKRLHRSRSTRLVKSIPAMARPVNQALGCQLTVPLPMNRLMSWLTTSENISSGVNSR